MNEVQNWQNALTGLLGNLNKMNEQNAHIFNRYDTGVTNTQNKIDELLNRLQDKDNLGTGNPFVDMLDGYIRMKKKTSPDYQWEGLLPKAMRGIGNMSDNIRYQLSPDIDEMGYLKR